MSTTLMDGAVCLTDRPKKHGETPQSEGYAWIRPPAKIVDDGFPNIFVRTAFAEDGQSYNRGDKETDMDKESRALHQGQKPSEKNVGNKGHDNKQPHQEGSMPPMPHVVWPVENDQGGDNVCEVGWICRRINDPCPDSEPSCTG